MDDQPSPGRYPEPTVPGRPVGACPIDESDDGAPDKRRQRRKPEIQDQTSLTGKEGKKYMAVSKIQWVRDEASDTPEFFMFKRKSKQEILEGLE